MLVRGRGTNVAEPRFTLFVGAAALTNNLMIVAALVVPVA